MMKKLREYRISVFSIGWWFYVIVTFVLLAAMTAYTSSFTDEKKYRFILIVSVIELIILRIYKFSLKDIRSDYNYFNELPCYLCNQSTLMCIVASIIHDVPIMAYCVAVGTLGAVLAYVMPDSYNQDQRFFSKQAFGFYGYHGLLIVTCLSFYTMGLYEPKISDCIWPAFYTFVLATIAHFLNLYLRKSGLNPRANYVFTIDPDNIILKKMYALLPVPLLYMLPVLPIFATYSAILFAILGMF